MKNEELRKPFQEEVTFELGLESKWVSLRKGKIQGGVRTGSKGLGV